MRGIPVLCVLVLALAGGSSAAQTRVAFLAAGDYGVGGSRELSLGLRMKGYESRNPANMLVTLGDNDYTESPARFRENWRRSFGWARRTGLRVAGVLGNHDYEVGARPLPVPAARDARAVLHAQARRRAALPPRLERRHRSADGVARAAARRVDLDLEDRRLPPPAVHVRRPFRQQHGPAALGAALRELRRAARPLGARPQLPALRGAGTASTYVVHGGGGAGLYRPRGCPSSYPPRVRARYEHGFLSVSIGPDDLAVSAVDLRGRVTDRFSLSP